MNPFSDITAGVVKGIVGGLDDLTTSDDERQKNGIEKLKVLMQPNVIQAVTNLEAAKHPNWFVSGARPALLWVCVLGLAWEFVAKQFVAWGIYIYIIVQPDRVADASKIAAGLPSLDTDQLIGLVMALLGLAGWRTVEKWKGVARG